MDAKEPAWDFLLSIDLKGPAGEHKPLSGRFGADELGGVQCLKRRYSEEKCCGELHGVLVQTGGDR